MSPFIADPDEIDVQDGLSCWLNEARACGPDCVAFNIKQLDEYGKPIAGPEACTALSSQLQSVNLLRKVLQLSQDRGRVVAQPHMPGDPGYKG